MAEMNVGNGQHSAAHSSLSGENQTLQLSPEASVEIVDGSYDANKGGIQVKLHYEIGDKTVTVNLRLECKDPSNLRTADKLLAYSNLAKKAMSYHNIGLTLVKDPAALNFGGSSDATERLQSFFKEGSSFVCTTDLLGRNTISLCTGYRGDERETVEPQFSTVERMTGCWNSQFALRTRGKAIDAVAMEIAKEAAGCGVDQVEGLKVDSTGIPTFDKMYEDLSRLEYLAKNSKLEQPQEYAEAAAFAEEFVVTNDEGSSTKDAADRLLESCHTHYKKQVNQAKVMLGLAQTKLKKAEAMREAFSHTLGYDQTALDSSLKEAKHEYAQIACFLARASGDDKTIQQADKLLESVSPDRGASRVERGNNARDQIQAQINTLPGSSIDTGPGSEFYNASDHLALLSDPLSARSDELVQSFLDNIPEDNPGDGLGILRSSGRAVEKEFKKVLERREALNEVKATIKERAQAWPDEIKAKTEEIKELKYKRAKTQDQAYKMLRSRAHQKKTQEAASRARVEMGKFDEKIEEAEAELQDLLFEEKNLEKKLNRYELQLESDIEAYGNAIDYSIKAAESCLKDENFSLNGEFGVMVRSKVDYDAKGGKAPHTQAQAKPQGNRRHRQAGARTRL